MSRHESGLTCLHAAEGLCPSCQEEYDEDALAWIEFGSHPAGVANMEALREEMLGACEEERAEGRPPADGDEGPADYDDVPF